uniref:YcaO domain-containing protein n=1 Tax=Nitratidesulfovibrio vulgaris (strain DSM 19637 / Miyazaki F) TaxID=883 RepID=B8DN22_NITV9
MIKLSPCPKGYTKDQDKATSPVETVRRVRQRLASLDVDILAETRRVDVDRLGIPVFLSMCGADAKRVMPTRKQMGKGASVEQAEASALMELMERYSFFTFWRDMPDMVEATWSEAQARFGDALLPVEEIAKSVHDPIAPHDAVRALDLIRWKFFPATVIPRDGTEGREVWLPLDWFKKLGEFNGSSAGNTEEESILQGACELVERHVCCIIDETMPELPTIDISPENSGDDAVLRDLLDRFARHGVQVVLKDFSLGLPVPTVGAVAWDPATFPVRSEIVYTAGTAATPVKAAVRALTEIAQLAGDFITGACYEASGLPKYERLEDIEWLRRGPVVPLSSLPTVESDDILRELTTLSDGLARQGYTLLSISTRNPDADVSTHYNIVPGFRFRERDKNASIGLFVGRILSEEADAETALRGLEVLAGIYPGAHFVPFFRGMLALRAEALDEARHWFETSEPLQPDADARGLAAFYGAYVHTLAQDWAAALPGLDRAVAACPEMKEYFNLRGVCHFKLGDYAKAAANFESVLHLDKGSVIDLANLGLCHKFLGDADTAAHLLEAALEIDPSLDFARTHLSELRAQAG